MILKLSGIEVTWIIVSREHRSDISGPKSDSGVSISIVISDRILCRHTGQLRFRSEAQSDDEYKRSWLLFNDESGYSSVSSIYRLPVEKLLNRIKSTENMIDAVQISVSSRAHFDDFRWYWSR